MTFDKAKTNVFKHVLKKYSRGLFTFQEIVVHVNNICPSRYNITSKQICIFLFILFLPVIHIQ